MNITAPWGCSVQCLTRNSAAKDDGPQHACMIVWLVERRVDERREPFSRQCSQLLHAFGMPTQLSQIALAKLGPAPGVMPEPLDTIVQTNRDGTDPNARTVLDRPPRVGHPGFKPLLWAIVPIAALVALVALVCVLGVVR